MTMTISIAKQFSTAPSGRYKADGPASGEQFRDELLIPALESGSQVVVDLNGVMGYGSSFLEEAFGGLVRKGFTADDLLKRLMIETSLNFYRERIVTYIKDASTHSQRKS